MSLHDNDAYWRLHKKDWPRWVIGCRARSDKLEKAHPELKFLRVSTHQGVIWAFKNTNDRKIFQAWQREWKKQYTKDRNARAKDSGLGEKWHGVGARSPKVDSPFE